MVATRRVARLSIAIAAVAILFATVAAPASAQQPAPYTSYGVGQKPGATIAANIAGRSCGAGVTVNAQGEWLLRIAMTDACTPRAGDVVSFSVDGQPAEQTVTWSEGGAPANAATGIALTVAATVKTTTTPTGTDGTFIGSIAQSGVSLASFTGSTVQLDAAAASVKATSVSATAGGKLLTFVVKAPAFVNSAFIEAFPTGLKGALVIVRT